MRLHVKLWILQKKVQNTKRILDRAETIKILRYADQVNNETVDDIHGWSLLLERYRILHKNQPFSLHCTMK